MSRRDVPAPDPCAALFWPPDGPDGAGPLAEYLASLGPAGRRAVRGRLRKVALLTGADPERLEAIPWQALTYREVEAIKVRLAAEGAAPATINLTLAALRGLARYAADAGLLAGDTLARIERVKGARGSRLPAGRAAEAGELARLQAACAADPTPAGRRDAALLALLALGGFRRAEIAALTLDSYRAGGREGPRVRVVGKGNKEREVPLHPDAQAALEAWLALRGRRRGPLFGPVDRWGHPRLRALSGTGVYRIVERRWREAGLPRLTPHDFRRTFIGDLFDEGVDTPTVQRLAGHANPTTTIAYDRRGTDAGRRAIARLGQRRTSGGTDGGDDTARGTDG